VWNKELEFSKVATTMFDKTLFHQCFMEIDIYARKKKNILMHFSIQNILLCAGGNVLVVVLCEI
jgi:hypothetical protein